MKKKFLGSDSIIQIVSAGGHFGGKFRLMEGGHASISELSFLPKDAFSGTWRYTLDIFGAQAGETAKVLLGKLMSKKINDIQNDTSVGEEKPNESAGQVSVTTVEGSQSDDTVPVIRDTLGRFIRGGVALPINSDGNRAAARKAFLDRLNGLAGEKRLERIAEIAEGRAFVLATTDDGNQVVIKPTIREQLDANTTLLYLQHGRPATQVDIQATHNVKVRWNPDRYQNLEDLEKYLELQRLGEAVEGEVVKKGLEDSGEE